MSLPLLRHKDLVILLRGVPPFPAASYELEQYKTSAELAADILYAVEASFGGLRGALVADLGCGTGVLGIGAAALGATVLGIDVDAAALECAAGAAKDAGLEGRIEMLLADVVAAGEGAGQQAGPLRRATPGAAVAEAHWPLLEGGGGVPAPLADGDAPPASSSFGATAAACASALHSRFGLFDCVITNPPFGTRTKGADVAFIRVALLLASPRGVVYSLHKSSTRAHLIRLAHSYRVGIELVAELRFPIPATYAFHAEASADVAVDLLRWRRGPPRAVAESLALTDRIPVYGGEPGVGGPRRRRGRGRGR